MKQKVLTALFSLSLIVSGCSASTTQTPTASPAVSAAATQITLSDDQILVDGQPVGDTGAVKLSHDIVYYQADQGEAYGEGGADDEHSEEEAQAHTVITISEPGTVRLSGTLSVGQIAIDLGEDAKDDPNAVVTLILDQADITCTVAPAILVYNAYECAGDEASSTVDTQSAGFNLVVADGTDNAISGAYVTRIYKEGTTDKLHKYDAAIESKVSMNLSGEADGSGTLSVEATNEGIESSMHMTINSGNWIIHSADDSLNANEDGISVITINGGTVRCNSGAGTEGDGIDSNGWIVINGGTVIASANPASMDSGLDSDNGILINGGTVLASGNMFDEIDSASTQPVMVFSFAKTQPAGEKLVLTDSEGQPTVGFYAANDYTGLVYSSPQLSEQDYTLASAEAVAGEDLGGLIRDIQSTSGLSPLGYTGTSSSMGMRPQGGARPGNQDRQPGQKPQMTEMPEGERPAMDNPPADGNEPPEGMERPEGANPSERPVGTDPGSQPAIDGEGGRLNSSFTLSAGISMFSQIQALE